MGFLIIALVSFLLAVVLFFTVDYSKQNWATGIAGACVLLFLGLGVGSLLNTFINPIGEYQEDSLVSTKQIASYEILEKESYYIDSDEFIIFFEINEIISENGKKIETRAVTRSKTEVEIIRMKDCKMPRVEEYLVKWESTGWTFAKKEDKTVYKIYIPE